jgi:hypothetical protein
MNWMQTLLQRMEYGDYVPVKKYGLVYTSSFGREQFTLVPQLLKSKRDWALRLDMNRAWGSTTSRTLIDLHFCTPADITAPFERLLDDVRAGVVRPEEKQDISLFQKQILGITAGRILRNYGRIDLHPKNAARFRVDLFLTWDGRQHWLLLREGEGSVEWTKWPVEIAETIVRLLANIGPAMRREATQSIADSVRMRV